MAREYAIIGANITVAGASTLVFVNPPAARTIKILRCWASQEANATSAQCSIELGFKASAFPTLTSFTPQRIVGSDPASYITGGTAGAAGTCGINASAEGAGATTPKRNDVFNALIGYEWTPVSNGQNSDAFVLSGADSLGFYMKFRAAPATLTGWNFGLVYAEL